MDEFAHTRSWLAPAAADALMELLVETLPWEQKEITLFGRTHPVPRLTCWLGQSSYTYSGVVNHPSPWPPQLRELGAQLSTQLGTPFNSILANHYRDGADTMGWHRDNEPELGPEPVIASVNLGATRDFVVRHRASGQRTVYPLAHGDLVVMRGRSQIDWEHSVPARRRVHEPRINLTFRHFMER